MEILGYIATILVGLTLGLIGSGGTILTVPILVYLFKIQPELATTYSLFIVGLNAIFGSINHFAEKNINFKIAFAFAFPSVITLLFVRQFLDKKVPDQFQLLNNIILSKGFILMILFALLMIYAGYKLLPSNNKTLPTKEINLPILNFLGLIIGLIMGILGAGGGFLIVPTLIIYAGMDFNKAVATSLFIVAINSIVGFMGDMLSGTKLEFQFLIILTLIAMIGMVLGSYISKKITSQKLKPIFGGFIIILAIIIIIKEIVTLKIL